MYAQINAVFESFDIGVFIEAVLWWDYSVTSATRDFCYSAGWATDEIEFTLESQATFRECYKTIFYDLENPIGAFTDKSEPFFSWSNCDTSSSTDVAVYDYNWFDTTSS